MSESKTVLGAGAARESREIKGEEWISFLAQFTRENRGAHARLSLLGGEVGYQVETEDRPFNGISADVKSGENAVWITFGSTPADHLAHGIQKVTAIRELPPTGQQGAVVEIEEEGGTRTLLELTTPDSFALPPGEKEKTPS